MPRPLTEEYQAKTQQIIADVPRGPWTAEPSEHGGPFSVGPICWLETYDGDHQAPVARFVEHAREALSQYVGEVARLTAELAASQRETAAARQVAEEMRGYCSPYSVSVTYADRLVEAMDRARLPEHAKAGVSRGR